MDKINIIAQIYESIRMDPMHVFGDYVARVEVHENKVVGVHLAGEESRAMLISHLALCDTARAEFYNAMAANAPRARGHVDCKGIVVGNAFAKAVPIVEANHPLAHITHEAAIGIVDSKQLQTLLTRGLTEEEATDIIIEGLLSKKTDSFSA